MPKLATMYTEASSARATRSRVNALGDNVRLLMAETGRRAITETMAIDASSARSRGSASARSTCRNGGMTSAGR
jgi:hypothetical protein